MKKALVFVSAVLVVGLILCPFAVSADDFTQEDKEILEVSLSLMGDSDSHDSKPKTISRALTRIRDENPESWETLRTVIIKNPSMLKVLWKEPFKSMIVKIAKNYGYDEKTIVDTAKKIHPIIKGTDMDLIKRYESYLALEQEKYQQNLRNENPDKTTEGLDYRSRFARRAFTLHFNKKTGIEFKGNLSDSDSSAYLWSQVYRRYLERRDGGKTEHERGISFINKIGELVEIIISSENTKAK